jgi:hypothetical protein
MKQLLELGLIGFAFTRFMHLFYLLDDLVLVMQLEVKVSDFLLQVGSQQLARVVSILLECRLLVFL